MSTAQEPQAATAMGMQAPGDRLPASTHIGRVRLAVSNLERSVVFYSDVIGLQVLDVLGSVVRLGAGGRAILELESLPDVQPLGRGKRLGLYHTAFLLPSRTDLSAFVQHLSRRRVPFGAADHLVSEALYLVDPDGLEVEVYADRPREAWPYEGPELRMATQPVRWAEMPPVAEDAWQGAPAGTTVGHIHLYVGDLQAAAEFYHHGLGLDITTRRFPGALFTSAGGYHHHVGLNTWAAASPIASKTDARLLHWELVLPADADVEAASARLRSGGFEETVPADASRAFADPWGIRVALVSAV